MPLSPLQLARFDWRRAVLALTEYAYARLAPEVSWNLARRMTEAILVNELEADADEWDPKAETLLRYFGRSMRELVFAARDDYGTGGLARETSPDWDLGRERDSIGGMRKNVRGPMGMPVPLDEQIRARRRLWAHAVDVIVETRKGDLERPPCPAPPFVSRDHETMVRLFASMDQDNFDEAMPRKLLEELVREQGGDPDALWARLEPVLARWTR